MPNENIIDTAKTDEMIEVIGICFKDGGKIYYFAPNGNIAKSTDFAIVETARGIEFGRVCTPNKLVSSKDVVPPLKPVIRIATPADIKTRESIKKKEEEAIKICQQKVSTHKLEMKLIEAEYTFDMSKLTFYFTADGRIDFRELVKDLASTPLVASIWNRINSKAIQLFILLLAIILCTAYVVASTYNPFLYFRF